MCNLGKTCVWKIFGWRFFCGRYSISFPFYFLSSFTSFLLLLLFFICIFPVHTSIVKRYSVHHAPPLNAPSPPSSLKHISEKWVVEKGFSAMELDKLPKVTAKELVLGTECAVCLDEIENDQPARLVPSCNHGFHL